MLFPGILRLRSAFSRAHCAMRPCSVWTLRPRRKMACAFPHRFKSISFYHLPRQGGAAHWASGRPQLAARGQRLGAVAGARVNADRVASYQDWRGDLLRGVGSVTGLPYALADPLIGAWINPDAYDIACGSIDMSPWGFPTDRAGTIEAIRARADLLRRVWTASSARKIPQNVHDREVRFLASRDHPF